MPKSCRTSFPFPKKEHAGRSDHQPSYEDEVFDIMAHAWASRFIGWLSPASFSLALFDWMAHLSISPAKRLDLLKKAAIGSLQLWTATIPMCPSEFPFNTRPNDKRFQNPLWCQYPFELYAKGFLMAEHWWHQATSGIRGVSSHHRQVVNFTTRQLLDMASPSNYPATNPEILSEAFATRGASYLSGLQNLAEDIYRTIHNLPPAGSEQFQVGIHIAITPGKVVYRNHLVELIQYEPTTTTVHPEPIFIVPAWIMKYYILDLSPHNSLVKYLISKGHTVFMISWRNPGSEDRDLGLDDYLNMGILESLQVIGTICPDQKIHATGYCIGGTLLMIAAAWLAAQSDETFATLTLFAAQVDFKEAGELLTFVDASQVSYLEDIMWQSGYLNGPQMTGAFSMLHSNDLIWSFMVQSYLLGKRRPMIDLVAWDHDTTRLPFRMHSEYLRSLLLNNDLAQGRFKIARQKIALMDITQPIFAVGTLNDHISPWRSVYKVGLYCDTERTFVLTSSGHNAGIISEPGKKGRAYQMLIRRKGDKHMHTDTWQEKAPQFEGSWWPAWQTWLASKSTQPIAPPPMGRAECGYAPLCDAPGTYVLQE